MQRWHQESNFIVVLNAAHEPELLDYWARVGLNGLVMHRVIVHEPDIGNHPTAFAALGEEAGRVLSALPLALKEKAML